MPAVPARQYCGAPATAILLSRTAGTCWSTRRSAAFRTRRELARRLAQIPGVVEHGLFIGMTQAAIIAGAAGVQVIEKDKKPSR